MDPGDVFQDDYGNLWICQSRQAATWHEEKPSGGFLRRLIVSEPYSPRLVFEKYLEREGLHLLSDNE